LISGRRPDMSMPLGGFIEPGEKTPTLLLLGDVISQPLS
jgi:hypothetical protein